MLKRMGIYLPETKARQSQGSSLRDCNSAVPTRSRHSSAIPRCCVKPPFFQLALRLVDFDECVVQCFLQRHRLIAEQLSGVLAAATRAFLETPSRRCAAIRSTATTGGGLSGEVGFGSVWCYQIKLWHTIVGSPRTIVPRSTSRMVLSGPTRRLRLCLSFCS